VTEASAADVPAVVAVCVTSNPGSQFRQCLESLVAQDYPNLSILVIDAGSDTPVVDEVAEIAPEAFIHRLQTDPGFSAAANQGQSLVSDAPFLMFCHDDVALDAHCVSALVEEVFRSNAGIVTPKFVDWDDHRRLSQVGMGSDRFGVMVDLVEPGEFDQEQYDGVRDVFVAPSGVQLVRADLFNTLGGFDPALRGTNEDLDFSWRAHAAGARVVVVPSTFVRHKKHDHSSTPDRGRILARNRLRTVLVTSSRLTLLRTMPLVLALMVMETVYRTVSGRRAQAGAALGALSWNLSRLKEIRARRAELRKVRQISDAEVRALQVGGSARLSGFFRGQFGSGQDRLAGLVGSVRANLTGADASSARAGFAIGALLILVGIFGSRHLITRGTVSVGQIPVLPEASVLLNEWWGGWRSIGIGGEGWAPVTFLALGLVKLAFFWGDGVLDLLLVVGPLAFGAVGAWRLASPLGSVRASAVAAVAYAANPLPVAAISAARWEALVVWGAAPFMVGAVLRLQRALPFRKVSRSLPTRLLRYGLLVGLVSAFAPPALVVAVVIPASLAIAAFLIAKPAGIPSLVLGAVAAVVVPIAIHAPWSVAVANRFSWEWLIGPRSPEESFDSLADLIRFAPGSIVPGFLVGGLLAAAAVGLLIGRGERLDASTRGWTLALSTWGLVWAGRRGWLPLDLPAAEVLLPVAAAGLSLAVGATVRSIELDLAEKGRLWRNLNIAVAGVSLVVVALLGLQASLSGRWQLPTQSYAGFTALLAEDEGPSRVLWLGHPSLMTIDTQRSPGGIYYAITNEGNPDVVGRFAPGNHGINDQVGERLDLVVAGQTSNLGRLLAPYGIDVVIVVPQLAPAPYEGPSLDPGGGIAPVLDRQLDLRRVSGTPSLAVYQNDESRGPAVELPEVDRIVGVSPAEQLDSDFTVGRRANLELSRPSLWLGAAESTDEILLAVPADGWQPANSSTRLRSSSADTLVLTRAGDGPLGARFQSPTLPRLLLVGQLLLIGAGVALATRRDRAK